MRRRLFAAGQPPWLHGEVARRMGERLPVIRLQPTLVLDWWAAAGGGRDVLARAYPRARVVAVEPDGAAAVGASAAPQPRRWLRWSLRARPEPEVQTVSALAAGPPGQAGLVWANMTLHHVADPQNEMRHWHRALQVDGFLMFSTLGPGSLALLRDVYRDAGWPPPHAPFVDMHDLGDMLAEAGFADPVMDQEPLTLTYDDPARLLAELRGLGGNADPARAAGLRTPRWRARLLAALRERAAGGRIGLGFEVVYGHAFRPAPRLRVDAEARLAPEELLAMARAGRRPPRAD
ncbi:MAG: class I SAM-dependent methyltransferase [Pseudomonadota bacterium]|nr:class I SAM-dependent methyltransferase [Rubrivivax sp.]